MLQLDEEQKLFIIRHLAAGVYPSACAKKFQEEYGIAISRSAVEKYDPRRVSGYTLSKELKEKFYDLQTRFLRAQAKIPVSHKNVRLATIDSQLDGAIADDDRKTIVKLLDLARKELDPFESRRGLDEDDPD